MNGREVTIELTGQIVGPCIVRRTFGPFLRVQVPVKGNRYQLKWIPSWRVVMS